MTGGTATNAVDTPLVPNTPALWERDPQVSKTFGVPADQQTTNFFHLNEGWRKVGPGMYNPLTGEEPTYGGMHWDRNILDQNQTNWAANDVLKVTRVQQNKGSRPSMFRIPSMYPTRRGRPDKTNYPASSWY